MRPHAAATIVALLAFATPVQSEAGRPSALSAAPLPAPQGHHAFVGWPSVGYEWWNRGKPDWALGAEIVYGDWSGSHTDIEVGFAANGRMRWRLDGASKAAVAFQFSPGVLLAATEGPVDRFVFGVRGEVAVPVSISLHQQVNLLTGASVPVTVVFVEKADPFVAVPLMGRIGVEITATRTVVPWFLLELGPGFAFGDGGVDTELSFRVNLGVTFW